MRHCKKIRKKNRKYCGSDLRDEIVIQDRSITPPLFGVDFTETFTGDDITMCAINTVSGKTFFDDVGEGTAITHVIGFRFIAGVTAENWILFEGRRMDILSVEDLDERHIWMEATCTDKGTKVASQI